MNDEYTTLKQKDAENAEIMKKLTEDLEQIPQLSQQNQELKGDFWVRQLILKCIWMNSYCKLSLTKVGL